MKRAALVIAAVVTVALLAGCGSPHRVMSRPVPVPRGTPTEPRFSSYCAVLFPTLELVPASGGHPDSAYGQFQQYCDDRIDRQGMQVTLYEFWDSTHSWHQMGDERGRPHPTAGAGHLLGWSIINCNTGQPRRWHVYWRGWVTVTVPLGETFTVAATPHNWPDSSEGELLYCKV